MSITYEVLHMHGVTSKVQNVFQNLSYSKFSSKQNSDSKTIKNVLANIEANVSDLPLDMMTEVSKHLAPEQIAAFRLSCKEGKRLIDEQSKFNVLSRGIQRLKAFKLQLYSEGFKEFIDINKINIYT